VLRGDGRRLPINGAGHQQPVHGLHAPTAPDEFAGQPVEQLGVGGRRPRFAEIAGRLDERLAEVMLPQPVHHHPGGQRMIGPHQPSGEGQPASRRPGVGPRLLNVEGRLPVCQHRRHAGTDKLARRERVAAAIDVRRRRLAPVPQRLNLGLGPELAFERLDPILKLLRLAFERGRWNVGRRLQLGQRRSQRLDGALNLTVVRLPGLPLGRADERQQTARQHVLAHRAKAGADVGLEPVVLVVGPLEDRQQPVVVALGNRVEFVAVAAGALEAQTHHGRAEHVHFVGDDLQPV
jgi:hypothetical protein